jgi:hypothetical protein
MVDPSMHLIIDHLFSAPLNDTHHYYFETGDCFDFEFNQPIFQEPFEVCFPNFICEILDASNFRATLTGPNTPKIYGKMGRLSNPSSGLVLQKV